MASKSALPRYHYPDAYTIQELLSRYTSANGEGRIRLLHRLYRNEETPPFELTLLAVQDDNAEVRRWFARHARLYKDEGSLSLIRRLEADADPFVRACLRENPTVYSAFDFINDGREIFQSASHLERLALVRNSKISEPLIERLLDPDDKELGLQDHARQELALAFLTNAGYLARQKHRLRDAASRAEAAAHLSRLWDSASRWPAETEVTVNVYQYVDAPDATRKRLYQANREAVVRRAIVESCDDDDPETLLWATTDTVNVCRRGAWARLRQPLPELLAATLGSEDREALAGLAENPHLPPGVSAQAAARLQAIEAMNSRR